MKPYFASVTRHHLSLVSTTQVYWTYVGLRDGEADGLGVGCNVCPMKLGANEGASEGDDVGENVRMYATPELLPIW